MRSSKMGYDPRAVQVKKAEKAMAILMYGKERERHFIREFVKVKQQLDRTRTTRNRGKEE